MHHERSAPDDVRLVRGTVVTLNPNRDVITDGALAIMGSTIGAVGEYDQLVQEFPSANVAGTATDLVVPGYVNGHQHLTGDRLIQSSIPDQLPPGEAIFLWSVPTHGAHTGDDDELSALLTLSEGLLHGITTTFEAGTVAFPDRIATAASRLGARLAIGSWGWDVQGQPYAGGVDEVIDRQRAMLAIADSHDDLVSGWVTLVGHDLMSDDLVAAASQLAVDEGVGMTFHLSPTTSDPDSYLARTGLRPVEHLNNLGVLGSHIAIAHGVHLSNREIEILIDQHVAVISCPWAYLRLGQGVTQHFRHLDFWEQGGRLALGCDAENAGDMVDGIRTAALFAGLAKDVPIDPTRFGAHDALELLTIRGAEALGIDDRVGSIEVGKQADLTVHDRTRPEWIPPSTDPVLQLVWGSDGRSVRDVYVAGAPVVADYALVNIDLSEIHGEAIAAGQALRSRANVPRTTRWPRS